MIFPDMAVFNRHYWKDLRFAFSATGVPIGDPQLYSSACRCLPLHLAAGAADTWRYAWWAVNHPSHSNAVLPFGRACGPLWFWQSQWFYGCLFWTFWWFGERRHAGGAPWAAMSLVNSFHYKRQPFTVGVAAISLMCQQRKV